MPCSCFPWLLVALNWMCLIPVVPERLIQAGLTVLKERVKCSQQHSLTSCKIVCLTSPDRRKVIGYYMDVKTILMLLSRGNKKETAFRDLHRICLKVLKTTDETCSKSYNAEECRQRKTPKLFPWMWVYPWRQECQTDSEGAKEEGRAHFLEEQMLDGEALNCHPEPGSLWRLLIGTVCRGLKRQKLTLN